MADLYAYWAAPPFGVRAGVMPVLALAFYLVHRSLLAIYVEGAFTPRSHGRPWVDDGCAGPSTHKVPVRRGVARSGRLVRAIAQSMSELSQTSITAAPLDAARAIVGTATSLPGWTRRTLTVSQTAQEVRTMLLKASDPHKVLSRIFRPAQGGRFRGSRGPAAPRDGGAFRRVPLDAQQGEHALLALDHVDRPLADLRARGANVKGITGRVSARCVCGPPGL